MFWKKSLKNALINFTILVAGIILIPAYASAASCSSTISGTVFAEAVCDFDTGNSIIVSSGGEVGGINQEFYNPSGSSITNNGIITNNALGIGIRIFDSSLSNKIINNGTIYTIENQGISIDSDSIVSGGISNSGSIISENYVALEISNSSTVNSGISNSGSIASNTDNPAILIRQSTTNGNINNSGTIRTYGNSNAFHMDNSSALVGNMINSGSIRGGGAGLVFNNVVTISGNINNSGSIIGDTDNGLSISNASAVNGSIINSGLIKGIGNNAIAVNSLGSVVQGITNQAGATILGNTGIYVNDGSSVGASGITNYGTITGSTNAIYINSDSDVSGINTYSGSVINGSINAVGTDVNIHGGEINGTMNVNSVNITSGSTFTMSHSITAQDEVNNAGTLATGITTKTITGNYTQSTGGVLSINAQDSSNYGQLAVSNIVDLSQSGTININILSGANITRGDSFNNVISASTLTTPTGGFTVIDNSRLLRFVSTAGASSVNITAADDATTSIAQSNAAMGNRDSGGAASKLDEIIALNPSGDWQNIIRSFNRMSSDQEIASAVSQTAPALAGATNSATIETMNTALRIVQARQISNLGISSGEGFHTKRNLWMKTFGSWGNQGNQDGVVGYDSNAYGIITGVDKDINDKTNLGLSVSYFNSRLKSNNGNNQVDVDSFLGIGYGSYSIDDKTEVNAQIAAGYNTSHSNRNINFDNIHRSAKGRYNGWNLHAGTGISHLVKLDRVTTIAPQLRMDYFTATNQGYNESGAGVLNLQVGSQRQAQLIPAVEVNANHKFTPKFSLAVNTGLGYDLINGRNTVVASFAGGGDEFITRGLTPSPWIIRSGAGLTWKQTNELDLSARYDRRDRGSYNNQTISLKLRKMF